MLKDLCILAAMSAAAWFALPAAAAPAQPFATSPCFVRTGAEAAQACEQLAQKVSHDIDTVRALGSELEKKGRFDDAATTYRTALVTHPDHRELLQRLIRARSQARSQRLLTGAPEPPPVTTADVAKPAAPTTPVAKPSLTTAPAVAQPRANATAATSSDSPAARGPAAAAVAVAEPAPPPPPKPRYLALVIGNEQYADFTKLKTPLADVRALADLLRRDYGFSVTTLANATRYQIVTALSRLRQEATEHDNVLIYYAGHGYLDETTSRGYWLPVDAEHNNLANWLSTSDITDLLAGLQAKHALILADSCFSGTLLRSDATVAIDERQALLRKLSTRRSRSIMTSGGLEPVVDNGEGRHSVFAGALIRALRENRQPLEAARLFMQIRDRVSADAAQTPQYGPLRNAGHDGGDFIFNRN
jgi:hypothetical protein